jgi:hypothetical protein
VIRNTEYKKWLVSEMYARNGVEVKKRGVYVGRWIDEKKWERKLWRTHNANGDAKAGDVDGAVKKREGKGKGVRKDSSAAVNSDA